jgi:hypothetical protein
MIYGWAAMAVALCQRRFCGQADSEPRLADDLWSQLADYRPGLSNQENIMQFPRERTVKPRPRRGRQASR